MTHFQRGRQQSGSCASSRLPPSPRSFWATFILADLDKGPHHDYEALSYVWGNAVFPETLCLGEKGTHAITTNLSRCLVALRKPDSVRVLWVDAVCINQQDVKEKSQQVALMGKIYRGAKTVLIWLVRTETLSPSPSAAARKIS